MSDKDFKTCVLTVGLYTSTFGTIVVKYDSIVGKGNIQVTSSNDPTAHAEVVAIWDACKSLSTFQLDGCEIYTSCEPCPMCLGAIYWARVVQNILCQYSYKCSSYWF